MFCLRVGEAQNPGPFTIGAANPTGVLGKAHMFQEMPGQGGPRIWGLSETHLTQPGFQKLQVELNQQKDKWRFIHGEAAPPLSTSVGTIGGKATGVGILTDCPARPLAGQWPQDAWKTGRLQACAVHVQQHWVKAGVFYGYAKDAHTKATKDHSDALLSNLTDRIVFASRGFRVLMGDFNQTTQDLPQFDIWRQHGFREIQEIAHHRWQQEIIPTCKNKSVKDHVWISPELIDKLVAVSVDNTIFADHAVLSAVFSDLGPPKPVPIWRKPKEIQWKEIVLNEDVPFPPAQTYPEVFSQLEDFAHQSLQKQGDIGLIQPQRGRGKESVLRWAKSPVTPVKASRQHEYQIQYLGENYQHTKWCRQLRRIQSYVALSRTAKNDVNTTCHKSQLWTAIKAAPGFPKGFPSAWENRASKFLQAPTKLPMQPPDAEVAQAIFVNFQAEFKALEKMLNGHRKQMATARRIANTNLVFRDVSKPRAVPVQTVVMNHIAQVTEIQNEGLTIHYEPTDLACHQEVNSDQGPLYAAEHQPGKLTLDQAANVEVGDSLYQAKVIGDHQEIFAAFKQLWGPMWNRHNGSEPEWEAFAYKLATLPGASSEMPMAPITLDQWQHSVRSKKPTTATGPDGISRADLLHMPDSIQRSLLGFINQFDSGEQAWDASALVGHIANVEKSPEATAPKDYRPITVLTMPYRVWATVRARQCLRWLARFVPAGLKGNIPGRSTVDIWWNMALQIEQSTHDKESLSGVVTDITKAYNNLARPVVYACALHYGLPLQFVRAWHNSLAQVRRHFIVQGACSEAVWSTTGYPEGDPLSVVAMVLVNIALHSFLSEVCPSADVHTFVDNWEATARDPEVTQRAYAGMEEFAHMVHLQLDVPKTHFWATQAVDRKSLRNQNHRVILHTKDLGAQVNYTRRFTNHVSRTRIAKTRAFWGQLARSSATLDQKLRAIQSVAWPRCLHGIAVVALATEHFQRLRAQAMASLRWNKKGASATIQFGLAHPKCDPGFVALLDTVLTFRNFCVPTVAFPILSGIIANPPRHFDPGPCAVLLARIHEINWQWISDGFICDHEGFHIHLLDSPLQLLKQRLQHAWERQVGYSMQDRKDFAGLGKVDGELSRSTTANTGEEKGILRSVMNGTFYTRDKQIHTGKIPSIQCPFCECNDSLQHRIWECEFFQDLRQTVPPQVRDFWQQQPECTRYHAWFVEDWTDTTLRRALYDLSDHHVHCVPTESPEVFHLFLDGGCLNPTIPRLRVAGWGFCLAMLPSDEFLPIASGLVAGILQTPLRAEITAAIEAIRFAIQRSRPFYLWTDNKHVYNKIGEYLKGGIAPGPKLSNHDLWSQLHALVTQAKALQLMQQVVKIVSHVDITKVEGTIDKWVIRGNHAADSLVTQALHQLPGRLHQALRDAYQGFHTRQNACCTIQRFFILMGQRALSFKQDIREQDDSKWNEKPDNTEQQEDQQLSFQPFPATLQLPDDHSFGQCAVTLFSWLDKLTNGERHVPMWLSSYQLLIHYQGTTGQLGLHYNRSSRTWDDGENYVMVEGYDFNKFAGWLMAGIKAFSKLIQVPITVAPRLPWGTSFRCWQRCLFVPACSDTFAKIDRLLRDRGITAIKKVNDFQKLGRIGLDFR